MMSFFKLAGQAAALFILSSLFPNVRAVSITKRATTCNGHPELCSRTYGNVSFVGAHDSYAVGQNNLATNQDYNVTQQLTDGIRLLQVQSHNLNGAINLCHTSCALFNGGTLQDYLSQVKSWIDQNPNDVVTLLITNPDSLDVATYRSSFTNSGTESLAFTPTQGSFPVGGWPTLGSIIDSGKRLVVFMDFHADLSAVPFIMDEFANIWETPFTITDPSVLEQCAVNRTNGDPSTQMYLINHVLDKNSAFGVPAPDKNSLNTTNAATGSGSLGDQVGICTSTNGRPPNFLLVDFYEYGAGSVFQVAADLNGVQYNPSQPIAPVIPDNANGTTNGNGSTGSTSGATRLASDHTVWWMSILLFSGLFSLW